MVNNFITRSITAFYLLFLLLTIFFLKVNFLILLPLFLCIYYELYKVKLINYFYIIFFTLFYIMFLFYFDLTYPFILEYKFLFFSIFISFILFSFFLKKPFLKIFFLNFFIFFCFVYSSLLYAFNFNVFFIIIILTSFNDIVAYISGSYLKGPKIIPKVSPSKTWSGSLISYFISFLLLFLFIEFNLIFLILLPMTYFLGDIYFSNFKRFLSIKDYGSIIKGHGGLLDRLDSSLFSISFSFLFLLF